jgi:hypothetical protein
MNKKKELKLNILAYLRCRFSQTTFSKKKKFKKKFQKKISKKISKKFQKKINFCFKKTIIKCFLPINVPQPIWGKPAKFLGV